MGKITGSVCLYETPSPSFQLEDEALRKSMDERQRKGIGLVNLLPPIIFIVSQ